MTRQLEGLQQIPTEIKRELCGLDWIQRESWPMPQKYGSESLSVVDLFCGCGGLTLGAWEGARAYQRKLCIRLAVDTSLEALSVYRANFGINRQIARQIDVASLLPGDPGDSPTRSEKVIQNKVGELDLIIAGPPCQGHSDLNNITRRSDPRNRLYLKVVRAVELFQPRVVLIENVPTVIHDKTDVIKESRKFFREFDYNVSAMTVDASKIGLPQRRRRHFLVAVRDGVFDFEKCLSQCVYNQTVLSDYLAGLENEPNTTAGIFYKPTAMTEANRKRVAYLFKNNVYNLPDELRPPCHREKPHSYPSMYGRLRWDEPAPTITSGFGSMGQGRFVHPRCPRMLTPHEAARLQGFPDFFDFSSVKKLTALRKMIGNAVPPRITAVVVESLITNGIL